MNWRQCCDLQKMELKRRTLLRERRRHSLIKSRASKNAKEDEEEAEMIGGPNADDFDEEKIDSIVGQDLWEKQTSLIASGAQLVEKVLTRLRYFGANVQLAAATAMTKLMLLSAP